VNSLLFGRRAFSLENNDAAALVFNNYAPTKEAFEIWLLNGSMFRAKGLRVRGETLLVSDSILGEVPVAQSELLEIINTASQLPTSQRSD